MLVTRDTSLCKRVCVSVLERERVCVCVWVCVWVWVWVGVECLGYE